jgi:FkbM family methyltransferase
MDINAVARAKTKSIKWAIKKALLLIFFDLSNRVLKYPLSNPEDAYFGDVDTVIHAGAHLGEERIYYLKSNLRVYWIEANPDVFKILRRNVRLYSRQNAYLATLSNNSGETARFNIANLTGCSSLLEFDDLEVTPLFRHLNSITTITSTLEEMIVGNLIVLGRRNLLLVDTQGTELQVIQGAGEYISKFDYVITETQDYTLYKNQSLSNEIEEYLSERGFDLVTKETWASNLSKTKNCYQLVFKKIV